MSRQLLVGLVQRRVVDVRADHPRLQVVRLLCPAELCGRRRRSPFLRNSAGAGRRRDWSHNGQSESNHFRSDSSDLQTGAVRSPAEEPGGSVARRAASLALVLISA